MTDTSEHKNAKGEGWRSRLRDAIEVRRLEFKDVSKMVGKNDQYISRVLTGKANPTVDLLNDICKAIGIEMSYLFIEQDKLDGPSIDDMAKAMQLSETEAQLASRLLKKLNS